MEYSHCVSLYRLFPVEQRPDVGRHRHVYYDPLAEPDFCILSAVLMIFQCVNKNFSYMKITIVSRNFHEFTFFTTVIF